MASTMNLMNLPVEMLDYILSYLSYDQIAKARAVCRQFNSICSAKLNKGFTQLEQFHMKCIKAVKHQLPRRESERKHHPLSRHNDILMAMETRLSMLSMTFMKYIEASHCCFIPGKVLDEAFRVLRDVNYSSTRPLRNPQNLLPRPHDFLQEYRDISSMAMEYFDDKILPAIKEKMKLENPRVYRIRPSVHRLLIEATMKAVPISLCNTVSVDYPRRDLPSIPDVNVAGNSKNANTETMCIPAARVLKGLYHTKNVCSKTSKAVVGLHQNLKWFTKKIMLQNTTMKRKINLQRAMIKRLRKDVTHTRNTIALMSRDINRLKILQSPSKGCHIEDLDYGGRVLYVNSSPSSSYLPVREEPSSSTPETRGVKRKLDMVDEEQQ